MALVEFGDQAYVITPFTTDYDNIKLSLSLIGDFSEFIRFPDQGTLLGNAIQQGVALFDAFDYLDASGNLMVLFSDGEDSSVIASGTPVGDIVRDAVRAEVPIYFVRTATAASSARSCPTASGKRRSSRPAAVFTPRRTRPRSCRRFATSTALARDASSSRST